MFTTNILGKIDFAADEGWNYPENTPMSIRKQTCFDLKIVSISKLQDNEQSQSNWQSWTQSHTTQRLSPFTQEEDYLSQDRIEFSSSQLFPSTGGELKGYELLQSVRWDPFLTQVWKVGV